MRDNSTASIDTLPDDPVYRTCWPAGEQIIIVRSDIDALTKADGDGWLTDTLILFWQKSLEEKYLNPVTDCKIELIEPSVSFMLRQGALGEGKDVQNRMAELRERTHIIMPVNNSENPMEPSSGTHWSLLLVSLRDNLAFHYDSSRHVNESKAKQTVHKLSHVLYPGPQSDREIQFVEIQGSPQQSNSSDCGVMVCLAMKYLLTKKLMRTHMGKQVDMTLPAEGFNTDRGRDCIKELIDCWSAPEDGN